MPNPAPDQTLSRKLCSDGGGRLLLSHYPPGGEQMRHAHDHAQISFLLVRAAVRTLRTRIPASRRRRCE